MRAVVLLALLAGCETDRLDALEEEVFDAPRLTLHFTEFVCTEAVPDDTVLASVGPEAGAISVMVCQAALDPAPCQPWGGWSLTTGGDVIGECPCWPDCWVRFDWITME